MTWAKSSVGRSISRTGVFLKKQIWIWPIIAVVLLSTIGLFVRRAIEARCATASARSCKRRSTWKPRCSRPGSACRSRTPNRWRMIWKFADRRIQCSIRRRARPRAAADDEAAGQTRQVARARPVGARLRRLHRRRQEASGSSLRGGGEMIGEQDIPEYDHFLAVRWKAKTCLSPPFPSVVAMKDDTGRTRTGVPTMFVAAPIRDESFQVVGVLGLRIRPERNSAASSAWAVGETGETYAFDKDGLMVSDSRFDEADLARPVARPRRRALDLSNAGSRPGRRHHDGSSSHQRGGTTCR